MDDKYRPIKTPYAQKVADFKHQTLPILVWALSGIAVLVLLTNKNSQHEYIGYARTPEYEISANTRGTLKSVAVDLYDRVEFDDIVARLDDTPIKASIETINARVQQLRAELEAKRVELTAATGQEVADRTVDLRRFQIDEERRRLDALALKVVIESDQVELERLDLELRRGAPLREAGLISELELESLRLEHSQVERRVEENRNLLEETEQEFRRAQARRRDYEHEMPRVYAEQPLLRPFEDQILIETRRLEEIEVRRASLVLRSPVTGQVSQILCRKGQAVVPGEPILTIAERSVKEIVAYVDESDERRVTSSTPVLVANRPHNGAQAESVVLRVGPTVEILPQRLWKDPRVPRYGRAVIIAAVPGLQLAPGELVSVKFRSPD